MSLKKKILYSVDAGLFIVAILIILLSKIENEVVTFNKGFTCCV